MSTPNTAPARPQAAGAVGLGHTLRRQARALTPLITLLVLVLFFTIFSSGNRFATGDNAVNILQQAASLAVFGTALTFVLLIAEIDLSVGGIATATGVLASWLFVSGGWPGWAAALAGVVLGLICGLVNGLVIARIGVPSFMTTLAMGTTTTGIALYLTKGRPIFDVPEISAFLGTGNIGPIPVIILVALAVMLIGWIVLNYTRFGRYVYMVGGSREAAELSGVDSKMMTIYVMTISGLLAGFAGVVNTGRLGSANPDVFRDATLDTIAAVVLGGTSLFGGVGGISNTIIGLLVFGVLKNGLNMVNIDIYLKQFITGVILILALILNVFALKLGRAEQEATVEEIASGEKPSADAPPVTTQAD
ncbi:MAG: ABC transporter permease [Rudaea sp.]